MILFRRCKVGLENFFHNNQEIMNLVDQIEFDPDQAIKWGISLLGKRCGKYDEYDNVSSGFHSQWSSDLFSLRSLLPAIFFFRKKSCIYRSEKYFLLFFQDKKQTLFLKYVL